MPTYEYTCQKCDHLWEEDQSIKEEPVKTCPFCKNDTAKRLISGGSFLLKGDGWASSGYSSGVAPSSGGSGGGSGPNTPSGLGN